VIEVPAPADDRSARIFVDGDPTRLRDYFLRLGARSVIGPDGSIEVALDPDDDGTIADYLSSWIKINSTGADIQDAARKPEDPISIAPPPMPRLGEILLEKGMISESRLRLALAESKRDSVLLGRVLLRREWLFDDELARALAEQLQIPYVNLRVVGVDPAAMRLLPAELGLRVGAIPTSRAGARIRVAFADPCDEEALAAVAEYIPSYLPLVAELSEVEYAWRCAAAA
jgi:hypothetical protein